MNDIKSVLLYIVSGLALVAATFAFTGNIDSSEAELARLPAPTVTPQIPACKTTPQTRGYGYVADVPLIAALAPADLPGSRLEISGTVYANDCETPLPAVNISVWHADNEGIYDWEPPYILRSKILTDGKGEYSFSTIRPGNYKVNGSFQPAHIHYYLVYGDNRPFATRLHFADDPHLAGSLAQETAISTTLMVDGAALQGQFDIVMPVPPPPPTPTFE